MLNINFTGRNLTLSDNQKEYIQSKVEKHENLLTKALSINVVVTNNYTHKGVKDDYNLEINAIMPKAHIKVERQGNNINSLIDELEVNLKRKLSRYHDQKHKWENQTPWKIQEINEELFTGDSEPIESYNDYVPNIRRKTYTEESPMHPAEAVEKMELVGNGCFLFKNIETGKYAMLYKDHTGYVLVEPKVGS